MAPKKPPAKAAQNSATGLTAEERAALRETLQERKAQSRAGKQDGEQDVLAKIAEMPPSDRIMAQRFHALVKANAPGLSPRTWYGMPAYTKDGHVVVHFKAAEKFKERYASIGFSDESNLDEGHMWPTSYALTELTTAEEARIATLLKKAVG
jgi:uncharacterized protein YdhG (YjbR/CyaY superfamily)